MSVREFLERRPEEFATTKLHSMATYTCLSLVRQQDFHNKEVYAAMYWPIHAEDATRNGGASLVERQIDNFLGLRTGSFVKWNANLFKTLRKAETWEMTQVEKRLSKALVGDASTVLIAACFGLSSQLERILSESEQETERKNKTGENALCLASQYGHLRSVQILLNSGADVNAERGFYGTALQAASMRGHAEIVKLLLEKDANVNAEGGFYGNALYAGSKEGHAEIVKLLLKKDANVNAEGGVYGTALQAASAGGHAEIVKLLLEKDANVNAEGGVYGTALYVERKVVESLGVQEELLVEIVMDGLRQRKQGAEIVGELGDALEEESEVLVRRVWRLVVFWTECEGRGLA